MKGVVRLIFILFLLCLAGSFIHQAQAGEPKLLVPETVFDFGYAPPSNVISHHYLIKNVGTDTLKIERVRPG